MRGTSGAAQFMRVAHAVIQEHAPPIPLYVQLGTIGADYSLKIDHYRRSFAAGTYYATEALVTPTDPLATTSSGGSPGHTHDVPRPASFALLSPGDRVVVVLANGTDPIVLDRIYPVVAPV